MKKIEYIKPEIKEGVIIMESAINAASPFSFNDENGTGEGGVSTAVYTFRIIRGPGLLTRREASSP